MAKFKEVNRLSIAIGLLSSLAVFCWGFWEMFIKHVSIELCLLHRQYLIYLKAIVSINFPPHQL